MILISSWSGGKDSCLASYKSIKNGDRVKYLLNFTSQNYKRCCFHGIEAGLLNLQAELIGIPLIQKEVSDDMDHYEMEFKAAVSGLKPEGIEGMIFGDIYLDEHKDWVEGVCKDLRIMPKEPLWKALPSEVAEEFIDLGFRAIVVSCRADLFGKEFVGKSLDRELLRELKMRDICPCGENGEFHTLVIDGPLFKRRIEILEGEAVLREGFWKCWYLDIRKYR